MATRDAACSCGQLQLTAEGDPIRISMCHCLECQRRTGSIFGVQARWPREQVKLEGKATKYTRTGDSGGKADFYFCPACGSIVYWITPSQPDTVAIAVGAFADPTFPPPKFSVYESRRHPWSLLAKDMDIEHM